MTPRSIFKDIAFQNRRVTPSRLKAGSLRPCGTLKWIDGQILPFKAQGGRSSELVWACAAHGTLNGLDESGIFARIYVHLPAKL